MTSDKVKLHKIINNRIIVYPDSKDHGSNMGPTWVVSAPVGPHVGPMNFAIRVSTNTLDD